MSDPFPLPIDLPPIDPEPSPLGTFVSRLIEPGISQTYTLTFAPDSTYRYVFEQKIVTVPPFLPPHKQEVSAGTWLAFPHNQSLRLLELIDTHGPESKPFMMLITTANRLIAVDPNTGHIGRVFERIGSPTPVASNSDRGSAVHQSS